MGWATWEGPWRPTGQGWSRCDRVRSRGQYPQGVAQASDAVNAANGADVVITMLPSRAILRDGAAHHPGAWEGNCVCDCSTVDVDSAHAVASDAKCSRGNGPGCSGLRWRGRCRCGNADLHGWWTRRLPRCCLFEIMGQKAVRAGRQDPVRLQNVHFFMILGVTMIATCGRLPWLKNWIGSARLSTVVSTSSGQSWSVTSYCPVPGIGAQISRGQCLQARGLRLN